MVSLFCFTFRIVRILYRNNWVWAAATSGPQPIRVGEAQHLVLLPPPSRRPNPNGLPQPIRVRVRGGATPMLLPLLAAGPRGVPYPLYIVPPVDQYNHPILPQLFSTLTNVTIFYAPIVSFLAFFTCYL
jgi:hypothetical protein